MTSSQVSAQGIRDQIAALQRDAAQTADLVERTQSLRDAAYLALDLGDATLAMTCAVACLDAARRTPDLSLQARAHVTIALSMSNVHDDIGAASHFREAEGLARSARDARGVALVSVNAAHHDLERGHYRGSTLRLLGLLRSPYASALTEPGEQSMDQVFHVNFTRGAAGALLGQGNDQGQHAERWRLQQAELRRQLDVSVRALRRLHAGQEPLVNSLWRLDLLEALLIHTRFRGDLSAAHALAQHQIERLRSMPLGAAGLTPGAYADGGNPLRADGSAGGGKYNRTWTVSANDVPTWGLKTVTVRVCWAHYGNHCTSVAAYVRCSNVPCVGA